MRTSSFFALALGLGSFLLACSSADDPTGESSDDIRTDASDAGNHEDAGNHKGDASSHDAAQKDAGDAKPDAGPAGFDCTALRDNYRAANCVNFDAQEYFAECEEIRTGIGPICKDAYDAYANCVLAHQATCDANGMPERTPADCEDEESIVLSCE